MKRVEEECYEEAKHLLKECCSESGFVASPSDIHYGGIWTRDAAYTAWGALLTGEDQLIQNAAASLQTMASHQAPLGQIPNAVWPKRGYWDWGENGSTDSSALFIITLGRYFAATSDDGLVDKLLPIASKAASWLAHQDASNFGLIDSPAASEWMDSTLNRSGKVFYNNVLYAEAIRTLEVFGGDFSLLSFSEIVDRINALFWPSYDDPFSLLLSHVPYRADDFHFPHETSPNAYRDAASEAGRFYISHVDYGRIIDRCDVLANSLSVVLDVAPPARANAVLDHLLAASRNSPFPGQTWTEPDDAGDDSPGLWKSDVDRYQGARWRNRPLQYHNAGIWPFVGGFFVGALIKAERLEHAAVELCRLADANEVAAPGGRWGFLEWLDGRDGAPRGTPRQAWSAGAYAYAFQSLALARSRPA